MNYARRNRTVWAALLCVVMTMVVSPVLVGAQATTSDAKSETSKKHKKRRHLATDSAAEPGSATATPAASASTPEANPPAAPATAANAGNTRTTSGNSNPDIAAAQASGKVWVNLDSGIYHKKGRWYGKTKNGKFMTEAEAKAAGYKQSKRN